MKSIVHNNIGSLSVNVFHNDTLHLLRNDTLTIINNSQNESGSFDWGPIITIVVALIAALFALFQARSNTIAQARIKWIEELKDNISKFCDASVSTAYYFEMSNNLHKKDKTESKYYYEKYLKSNSDVIILSNKIKITLNPYETKHKEIIDIVKKIENYMKTPDNNISQIKIEEYLFDIDLLCQDIIKEEWQKSKKILWFIKVK